MNNLVVDLFESFGFIRQEVEGGYLFKTDEASQKTQFWLVIQENDLESLVSRQANMFDQCKQVCQLPSLDKNTYLLILLDLDSSLVPSKQNLIISIEEDPYFFKKQVLYYSVTEVDSIKELLNGQTLYEFIKTKLHLPETFLKYKANPREWGWQALLYRMAMKIPFVEINIDASEGLISLIEGNNQRIKSYKNGSFVEFDKKFFELMESSNKGSVKSDNPIELLNALMPALGGQTDGN